MDRDAVEDIFAPIGKISLRRMFGGAGVYLNGHCIAIIHDGMIWLKTDEKTRPAFENAGSRAFTYEKKSGGVSVMSFWLIPEVCFDDEDELKRFASLAEHAAIRSAQCKSTKLKKPQIK